MPVTSAPHIPKNAPISIIPSRPMFTTPLRSENMPPMAAKMSGVANASAERDQRRPGDDLFEVATRSTWTANTPATIASAPLATAPQPTRRSPRVIAATPSSAEIAPRMSGAAIVSRVRGGSVSQSATGASADAEHGQTPRRDDLRAGASRARGFGAYAHGSILPRPGALSRFRAAQTERMSSSAPTKSTTSPWMSCVRLPASSGGKKSGSRLRVDVPVLSAAKSSAAKKMPTAVLRPSSATAMPRKAIVRVAGSPSHVEPELPAQDVHAIRLAPANAPEIAIASK